MFNLKSVIYIVFMNWKFFLRSCFILLFPFIINAQSLNRFFSNPSREPSYKIIDEKCVYEGNWGGYKYEVWPPDSLWWQMYERLEQGYDLPRSGPWRFNFVVRRDPSWFVSGDLPRFSLIRTDRMPELNPHFNMLGDVRIRCTVGGKSFWLDDSGKTVVRFYPWGTVHEVELVNERIAFKIEGLLVGNRAIEVKVTAHTLNDVPSDAQFAITIGGADLKFINFFPPYITVFPGDEGNDELRLNGDLVHLKDPKNAYAAVAECSGYDTVNIIKNEGDIKQRVVFSKTLSTGKATMRFLLRENDAQFDMKKFDTYSTVAKQYYDSLLADYQIETPDTILNTGFYASILNLDYSYASPGWLEGIHQWNSYFSDNYQISAAISLGQLERAKKTILFFGDRPEGPGYVFNADGTRDKYTAEHSDEGLPYYILQLWRFWKATGDYETLSKVWKGTKRNFKTMLEVRDPDGNGLLNWHFGCNAFLYQSDHLQLPGDAASPSLMTCGLLGMMADMAQHQDDSVNASIWRNQADHVRCEIVRRLWLPDEGRFAAEVTPDGKVQKSSYYTDFVFPQLYSGLPAEYNWLALQACDHQLWIGDDLMRMGNYKPELFGNNAVGNLQMSEAAEAYFGAGRAGRGWALLHGSALGATILTDSPGSFPEFNSNTGWGAGSYCFSNPAAEYDHAIISGLFGIERRPANEPLYWHPDIPKEWNKARLRVKDIEVSVTSKGLRCQYELRSTLKQGLICTIPLEGRAVSSVESNGKQIPYKIIANTIGGELEVKSKPAKIHTFEVLFGANTTDWNPPTTVKEHKVTWTLPGNGYSVKDPQQIFKFFKIEGKQFNGILGEHTGKKVFFLVDKNGLTPCELDFGSETQKRCEPVVLKGTRENLPLDDRLNSDFIWGKNFWRLGQHKFDFTGLLNDVVGGVGQMAVGDYRFRVKAKGQNMLVLEVGSSNSYTDRQTLSQWPERAKFKVGKKVEGLDFLTASECQIRLTGMQVGDVKLYYEDGFVESVPLVYGDNIDCMMIPFASNVSIYKLGFAKYVSAFSVKADPDRILARFAIELSTVDANIGIFGINLVTTDPKH